MAKFTFQRVEKKYLLTTGQQALLLADIGGQIKPDKYCRYPISSIYYDTDRWDLIRMSIEKPAYKEKLRMRSYGRATAETPVFLELKKKLQGVVYKRRITLPYRDAEEILLDPAMSHPSGQILREMRYFCELYPVKKKVLLCYQREAYAGVEDPELRITFDTGIRFRQHSLRLDGDMRGTEILPYGKALMEIKAMGSMPLWLTAALSRHGIFPTSFSKYGTCFRQFILPQQQRQEVATSA